MNTQDVLATLKKSGKPQTATRVLALQVADPDSIGDPGAPTILATIEKTIHRSPNWARRAMKTAVMAIGIYKPALRKKAIEAAKRIGPVDVDHGETSCKTPDAAAYIEKAAKRSR